MQAVVNTFGGHGVASPRTSKRPVIRRMLSGDPIEPEPRQRRPGLPMVGKGAGLPEEWGGPIGNSSTRPAVREG